MNEDYRHCKGCDGPVDNTWHRIQGALKSLFTHRSQIDGLVRPYGTRAIIFHDSILDEMAANGTLEQGLSLLKAQFPADVFILDNRSTGTVSFPVFGKEPSGIGLIDAEMIAFGSKMWPDTHRGMMSVFDIAFTKNPVTWALECKITERNPNTQ